MCTQCAVYMYNLQWHSNQSKISRPKWPTPGAKENVYVFLSPSLSFTVKCDKRSRTDKWMNMYDVQSVILIGPKRKSISITFQRRVQYCRLDPVSTATENYFRSTISVLFFFFLFFLLMCRSSEALHFIQIMPTCTIVCSSEWAHLRSRFQY